MEDVLTDGLDVGLAEGLVDGVPFFQISFAPDLAHTYLTLETVLAVPTLVHLVPAIVAACAGIEIAERNTAVKRTLEYALDFIG